MGGDLVGNQEPKDAFIAEANSFLKSRGVVIQN